MITLNLIYLFFRVERKERARLKNVKFQGKAGAERVSQIVTLNSISKKMALHVGLLLICE